MGMDTRFVSCHVAARTLRGAAAALCIGVSMGVLPTAHAAGQTLRVVTDANYPPMEFFKDGQRTGFDVDIVEALAKVMGDNVQWIDIDFKGLIPSVQAGRADIAASALYITAERQMVVDFTKPYYAGGLVVVTRKDGPVKTVKDLDGRRASVQVGTKSVDFLRVNYPLIQRVEVDKNEEMFNLLLIRRADAIVTGKPAAAYFAQSVPGMTVLPDQLTTEQYGLATAKSRPELTAALNNALDTIKANGTYAGIVAKWFGGLAP